MVDLGWPWWVTTIVGLVVAAACSGSLFLTRGGFARGALAILVVEGVIIAALAPAVMDKASASSKGTPSAMSAAPRLTRTAFAHRADANCRALNRKLAVLGNPTTLPGIARKLGVVIPKFTAALHSQSLLRPPAEEVPTAQRWMRAMTLYLHGIEHVRAAAMAGDASHVAKANRELGAEGAVAARLSKQLGQTSCFQ